MNLQEIMALDETYFMNTFGKRVPVCFTHGRGMTLYGTDGKAYMDLLGGIAVSALGHAHPNLVKAITDQAGRFLHCSNLYYIETQARLARLLVDNSCADRVFFANSGAEANEGAIKLARLHFRKKGQPERYEIISLEHSFHGRTLATIAATGQEKYRKNWTPLMPKFHSVPMNDIGALEEALTERTCAVLLELVQGESGVHPISGAYIKAVRDLCDRTGTLLILDEIQTGLGRTGTLFAYEHFGVEPDIFTLAKALGGGVPIGAVLAREHVAKAFEPGDHGSTFGGNPLACAAGLATVTTVLEDHLVENSARMGALLKDGLLALADANPVIAEVRGLGLMVGIELRKPIARELNLRCLEAGYLVGNVGDSILRLLPPLVIEQADVERFLKDFACLLPEG
jgi:acetylornithine/N-succinyldiaminopimelate aminotransferase